MDTHDGNEKFYHGCFYVDIFSTNFTNNVKKQHKIEEKQHPVLAY